MSGANVPPKPLKQLGALGVDLQLNDRSSGWIPLFSSQLSVRCFAPRRGRRPDGLGHSGKLLTRSRFTESREIGPLCDLVLLDGRFSP